MFDVEDFYYGDYFDFEEVFVVIEFVLFGLYDWVDECFVWNGLS